jgi:hypothetical protein
MNLRTLIVESFKQKNFLENLYLASIGSDNTELFIRSESKPYPSENCPKTFKNRLKTA